MKKIYRELKLDKIFKEVSRKYKFDFDLDSILYYDCTNYFFEIKQEAGHKQYGPSKDHKPNPIVQMGLA